MNITCPHCAFCRPLPAGRLAAGSVIATCPRCGCRFRFTPATGAADPLQEPAGVERRPSPPPAVVGTGGQSPMAGDGAGSGDDPLPAGAIVPGRGPSPDSSPDDAAEAPEANAPAEGGSLPTPAAAAETDDADCPAAAEDRDACDAEALTVGNPWEAAPRPNGWLSAFYQTCMRVMFSAQAFFSRLSPDAPQGRALLFYVLVSVAQAVVERFWAGVFLSLLAPNAATDPELAKMLEVLTPQISLLLVVLLKTGVAVAQLYVLTVLLQICYGLVTGRRPPFSLLLQVAAYSVAPSVLCVVPLLGSLAGWVWMLACLLVGCRTVLHLTWGRTLLGFLPVILLLAPLLLQLVSLAQSQS